MTLVRTRLGAVFIMILIGIAATGAAPAVAQDGIGTLAIYAYACPDGIPSDDFSACREHRLAGVGFTAFEEGQHSGLGGETSADGDVSFSLGAIGGGTVNVVNQPPVGYETGYIACSQDYTAIMAGIALANVPKDGLVTCEWYFTSTRGASEPTAPPASDPDPAVPPVSALPNTGSGTLAITSIHDWLPALLGVSAMVAFHIGHSRWRGRGHNRIR